MSTSSGSRKAFQLVTNARIATVISAGRDSGSRIRQKKPSRVQPSIAAASSSSAGIAAHERPQDDDRDRQPERRLGQRHAERVVEQPERADQDVQRQDRHADREQQPQREERVHRLAARETR